MAIKCAHVSYFFDPWPLGHSAVCLALLQNGASAKLRDEEGDRSLLVLRGAVSIFPKKGHGKKRGYKGFIT